MTTQRFLSHTWNDGPAGSRFGEGISRPKANARTRQYRMQVKPVDAPKFIWTTFAENQRMAFSYAEARWPSSQVELLK